MVVPGIRWRKISMTRDVQDPANFALPRAFLFRVILLSPITKVYGCDASRTRSLRIHIFETYQCCVLQKEATYVRIWWATCVNVMLNGVVWRYIIFWILSGLDWIVSRLDRPFYTALQINCIASLRSHNAFSLVLKYFLYFRNHFMNWGCR